MYGSFTLPKLQMPFILRDRRIYPFFFLSSVKLHRTDKITIIIDFDISIQIFTFNYKAELFGKHKIINLRTQLTILLCASLLSFKKTGSFILSNNPISAAPVIGLF